MEKQRHGKVWGRDRILGCEARWVSRCHVGMGCEKGSLFAMERVCACGKEGKMTCPKCGQMWYCSKACLKDGRKTHRNQCSLLEVGNTILGEDSASKYALLCVCGKPAADRCARCNAMYYCSRECQKGHWKEHKKICSKDTPASLEIKVKAMADGFSKAMACNPKGAKEFLSKTDGTAADNDKIFFRCYGVAQAIREKGRVTAPCGLDKYLELAMGVRDHLDGKIDWLIKELKAETKRKSWASRHVLIHGDTLRGVRGVEEGPFPYTLVVSCHRKRKDTVYVEIGNYVDGIAKHHIVRRSDYVLSSNRAWWGKHSGPDIRRSPPSGEQIYTVIDGMTGKAIGARGLPNDAYSPHMENLIETCCGLERRVACWCLGFIFCSRECSEKGNTWHTVDECKTLARATNPEGLH